MNLDFSSEQLALRDTARDVFERTFPASALRALWNGADPDPKVWRALADVGVCGFLTPQGGGSEVDLALVLEEAGRAASIEPLVDTVAVASYLLPSRAAQIAAGDLRVIVASARMPFVADADRADVIVHIEGDIARAVDPSEATLTPVDGVDRARRLSAVEVPAGAGELITDDPDEVDLARARGAAATSGVLNGVGMRLLEMSVEHAKSREQFGRPIGSFQAVKHQLADAHVALDGARGAAWHAALELAAGADDAVRAASVAKAAANDAAALLNRVALQVHAGIGFTWEHDLHLWLKRGLALQAAWGTTAEHRAVLADHLFEEDTDA